MIRNDYQSAYSGEQLDAAILAVTNAGLDNLLHYRGVYASTSTLPAVAKSGDYAYVGVNVNALKIYNFVTSWIDSGSTIDIAALNLVDNLTGDAVDKAPNQKSVKEAFAAQSFAAVVLTNPFTAGKTPRRIGDFAVNTTSGEIWQATAITNAAASWNCISAGYYNGRIITNWDTHTQSGDITSYGTATGAPTSTESFYGHHINSNAGTANAVQWAIGYTTNKIYMRTKTASTWGAWSTGITAAELGYLSIIQLYDGTTAIYPRTKAEAVFFYNNTSKTLDQQFSQLEQKIIDIDSEDTTGEIEEIDIYDGETLKHQIKKDEANFSNLKSNGKDVITSEVISEIESDSDETVELTDSSDNLFVKIDKEKVAVNNYTYISGGSLNQTNKYLYKLNLDDLTEWNSTGWTAVNDIINNNGHYGISPSFGDWLYFNREYACDSRTFIIDFSIANGGTAIFSTFWRNGGIGNPVYVDFPNGKMSIYIESTLIVETAFSFVSYANTPLRIIISRENRVITATLINLVDFSQIAQVQTDVWVTSAAHLFDNFGIASQNAQIDISNFIVNCKKSDSLLTQIYITGDSITEGDKILDSADRWTTMLQQDFPTDSVIVSGRSAGTIDSVMARLYSECQFLHPIYVMVTIGTNGGNTAVNISNLIKKIYSYGAIPIINHVPCLSSSSQTAINEIIDNGIALSGRKVLSCKFDIATALDYDLSEGYDPTLFADGVHPNAAGCERLYKRVKIDCPELFN